MIRETAYATLARISSIKDRDERKEALREACQDNNYLALFLQYTFHPDVVWDLPRGEIAYRNSGEEQYGVFYHNVRKLPNLFTSSGVQPKQKLIIFINLLESVTASDAELLVHAKDKCLPWRKLSANFVKFALPELFPAPEKNEPVTEED